MKAIQQRGASQRRACVLARCPRSSARYQRRKRDDTELAAKLQELAANEHSKVFGYRKFTFLLWRDYKLTVNHKRVYRIYRGLNLRLHWKRTKHARTIRGQQRLPVTRPNERWSVDFVEDRLVRGRKFRAFNVVEDFTSECMTIEVDFSLPSSRVIQVFDTLMAGRGTPTTIRFDNGPEFRSLAMLRWGAERGIYLHFIDPGKPTQNGKVESFHSKFRNEFLNERWFRTLDDVRTWAEDWRYTYNHYRPHQTLKYLTPAQFASRHSLISQLSVA